MAELSDEDKAKRGALKDLIKEAIGEVIAERADKGRTDPGQKDAEKSGGKSIFDFLSS